MDTDTTDFAHMFDLAPVSLWLEDYSGVHALFARWRAEGVQDVAAFLTAYPERIAEYGASIRVLRVNQRTLELFAAPDAQTLTASLDQVFRGDMRAHALPEIAQLWSGANVFVNQTVNYALDGRRLDVHIRGRVLPGHEARWDRVLVSLEDNTAERKAQALLAASEQRASMLFEESPVSLWVEDFSVVRQLLEEVRAQGITDFEVFLKVHPEFVTRCMQEIRVVDVNRTTLQLYGARDKEELLAGVPRLFRGEMHESFSRQLVDLWNGQLVQQREVVNYTLGGEPLTVHMQFAVRCEQAQDWSMVLLSIVDITARKKAEAYLEYLGKHDVLTGLRNRAYYVEELARLSRKGPWPVGVVVADLNGLKLLNDEFGHAAGDAMLRRAGEVLSKAADSTSCVARIGGDEFCLLLPRTDEAGVRVMIERIQALQALNNQYYQGPALVFALGVALAQQGESLDAAVHRADQAMYAQKSAYYVQQGHDRRSDPS